MSAKFDEDKRTFETRLQFIDSIFSNLHSKYDIMASCIDFKLGISYKNYVKELKKRTWIIEGQDPIKILKKLG